VHPLLEVLERDARALLRAGWTWLLLLPIGAAVFASAARYVPNNWDSMTYHLARVAHWAQSGSVAPYPTHIDRQNLLPPGAEYLILVAQVVSGSDRLAAFVQLACWWMVILGASPLARLAGAPRRVTRWAPVIVAALPAAALQASTTQNDLVAAALTLAVLGATVPFLRIARNPRRPRHRRHELRAPRRWKTSDALLLGTALAAAALVKVSAIIVAAPFVALAIAAGAVRIRRGVERPRSAIMAVALVALVCCVFAVPETVRRIRSAPQAARAYGAAYLYPTIGEVSDRLANLGRGIVRQFPAPRPIVEAVGVDADHWCGAATWACGKFVLLADEDYAGNPFHVVGAVVLGAVAAFRRRWLTRRARIALVAAAAAWVLFHLVFRDNFWIARLELPIFVLSGLGLAALGGRSPRRRWIEFATAAAVVIALANATAAAARNSRRPPFAEPGGDPIAGYYPGQPKMRRAHDLVLDTARRLDCRRIGIVTGQDSHEYQLTWRAVQAGIEVRHVFGPEISPCLLFVVDAPAPPLDPAAWRPVASARNAPFLFASTAPSTTPATSRE
jgi:hypothetical protein